MINISKSFGNKSVLKNVSLTAQAGEILCLLGPSGSGKTTLIRLITGAIKPDEGEIMINSKRIPDMSVIKSIGFMPQSDAIYTDLTGKDNLLFFGRLFKLPKDKLRQRVKEILELVDLQNDQNLLAANYSGGMRKRLSLAIALLHDPDILLLDEPTVGIDPVLRKVIWDQFEALRLAGKTIVVSTHVMDEAARCQRAALIYNGSLIENDSLENLTAKTKNGCLEELFFKAQEAGEAI